MFRCMIAIEPHTVGETLGKWPLRSNREPSRSKPRDIETPAARTYLSVGMPEKTTTCVCRRRRTLLRVTQGESMNDYPYNFGRGGAIATAEMRNRVLRNTYWLLALSMVPTVLGAWIG